MLPSISHSLFPMQDIVDVWSFGAFNEKSSNIFCINFVFVDSGDDSDTEINEWENQQIRKGVTGAQVFIAFFKLFL